MSRQVMAAAIRGATAFVEEAEAKFAEAVDQYSEDRKIEFPETAFYLPMIYSLMGLEVQTLGELKPVLEHCRDLLPEEPSDSLWLPYLGNGLDAGAATLLSQEITCALRYLNGQPIEDGYQGFISDTIQRELGIQLVDGRMPGFAAILGPAPTNEIAVHKGVAPVEFQVGRIVGDNAADIEQHNIGAKVLNFANILINVHGGIDLAQVRLDAPLPQDRLKPQYSLARAWPEIRLRERVEHEKIDFRWNAAE